MARKSEYKEHYCDELIEHMSQGGDFRSFAGKVRVTEPTIHTWKKTHLEFLEAYEIGLELSYAWWEQLNRDGCCGKKQVNTGLMAINMRNRFTWLTRDKSETDAFDLSDDEAYAIWKRSRGER